MTDPQLVCSCAAVRPLLIGISRSALSNPRDSAARTLESTHHLPRPAQDGPLSMGVRLKQLPLSDVKRKPSTGKLTERQAGDKEREYYLLSPVPARMTLSQHRSALCAPPSRVCLSSPAPPIGDEVLLCRGLPLLSLVGDRSKLVGTML